MQAAETALVIGAAVASAHAYRSAVVYSKAAAQVTETELAVGAAVTLSRLQARLRDLVAAGAPHETGVFAALLEQLRYFAGVQIRNVATVGGCGAAAF